MDGCRKQSCHLVGPPICVLMDFCTRKGWHCPREFSLVSGRGQIRSGWLILPLQFEAHNYIHVESKRTGTRVRLSDPQLKIA